MATSLEELEKRLAALEQEMAALRQLIEPPTLVETPAERGARLLREARRPQPELAALWAQALEQMDIRGEPIGAQKVQQMFLASGIKPEDNEFSRSLIEMRDE